MTPVPSVPEGYPPITSKVIDLDNKLHGRYILWFEERKRYCELLYMKLRGRDSLPPLSLFQDPLYDVVAVECLAAWEQPIEEDYFLRRVLRHPKSSPMIDAYSFFPMMGSPPSYLCEAPAAHLEAEKVRKTLESV
jgi:hypothetical protein